MVNNQDAAAFPDLYSRIQFVSFANMPYLVYQACLATGVSSNTRYYQEAVCAKLAQDLGLDYEELLASLPPSRTWSRGLHEKKMVGPTNSYEEVK